MDKYQKEILDIIKRLNTQYQQETEAWLQHVYHLVLHDRITLNDVCDIGARYGLDIENSYNETCRYLNDSGDEDNT